MAGGSQSGKPWTPARPNCARWRALWRPRAGLAPAAPTRPVSACGARKAKGAGLAELLAVAADKASAWPSSPRHACRYPPHSRRRPLEWEKALDGQFIASLARHILIQPLLATAPERRALPHRNSPRSRALPSWARSRPAARRACRVLSAAATAALLLAVPASCSWSFHVNSPSISAKLRDAVPTVSVPV